MAVLLSILIGAFLYPFAIYPLALWLITGSDKKPRVRPRDYQWPTVTMVVCALNEEGVIGDKLANSLNLDYPPDRLRFVFVSDGSTDRTAKIIGEVTSDRITLIDQPQRRGKVANLNEVIPSLDSEIVLLSDANVMYRADAVRSLAARFAEPDIGCVSGRVSLTGTHSRLSDPERTYYSLEWFLQKRSSDLYSMAGADGAMYAFRREAFAACPNDTLIEDFVIPMTIIRRGWRVVFEPEAEATEVGPQSLDEEYRRKVRIAAGAAQSFWRGNGLPGRAPLRFWWIFVSHKLMRWLSPFLGLAALAVAALSPGLLLSQLVLATAALWLLGAAWGWGTGSRPGLPRTLFYFLFGEAAMLIGIVKGTFGLQPVTWAKRNR